MSIRHLSAIWEDPYFQSEDKSKLLVALAIADSARSEDGRAWPSIETLAAKARTSIRRTQEAIKELETDGKLTVEYRKGPMCVNVYVLLCKPDPATVAPPPRNEQQETPQPNAKDPATKRGRPRNEAAPGCTQTVRNRKEPSKEPLKNQHSLHSFDEFWKVYPKKIGKKAAARSWERLTPDEKAKAIESIPAHVSSDAWTRNNGRYIPNPQTFLNQGRWDDVLPEASLFPHGQTQPKRPTASDIDAAKTGFSGPGPKTRLL